MEEVDKEISETRLSLNTRARTVAESYLATVRSVLLFIQWALLMPSLSLVDLRLCGPKHIERINERGFYKGTDTVII